MMDGRFRSTYLPTVSIVFLLISLLSCEYVRPTLNAPLEQWKPGGGYRFSNLAPPEADNTDGLFFMAAFSGGGTRPSTLAFGALRELARQSIAWDGKRKRLLDELDGIFALSRGDLYGGLLRAVWRSNLS